MEENNIVTLFVENRKGNLLIQKRSKQKGSKYGFISGHIQNNETNSEGIIRETKEEIGIDICKENLKLFHKAIQGEKNFYLYYTKKDIDINDLILQKEEVESAKWCSIEEIERMIDEEKLYKNHIEAFEIAIDYLSRNNI